MSRAEGTLGLVLEYCAGGNLLEYAKQLGTKEMKESHDALAKTFRQFARFGWQICDGMLFLGTKNLVHRDLAARNVLLDGEQCAKVEKTQIILNLFLLLLIRLPILAFAFA
jgi:serine/threonine protein kinase